MKKLTLLVVLLVLAGAIWYFFLAQKGPQNIQPVPAVQAVDYKNATYIIQDAPVTLVNGLSEVQEGDQGDAAYKTTTKYFGNEIFHLYSHKTAAAPVRSSMQLWRLKPMPDTQELTAFFWATASLHKPPRYKVTPSS